VSIRRATAADADVLAAIQEEASRAGVAHVYPPEQFPFPVEAVRERWHRFTADGGWAVLSGEGFAAIEEPWLEALYVRPTSWGSGIADELHDAAVAELQARGCERARLWVLERNSRARRFYERHGWRPDGTSRVVEFPPNPIDLGYALGIARPGGARGAARRRSG
jgi:GNAT superfamily N-acetyltransferase